MLSRRLLLASTPLAIIAACSSSSTPVTPQQIIVDLDAGLNELDSIVPQLMALPPPPILTPEMAGKITADVALARAALAKVSASASLQDNVPALQRTFAAMDTAVAVVEGLPLPPATMTAVVAAGILLHGVEVYIATQFPASTTVTPAATKAKAMRPNMSVEQARAELHVPTVH